MLELERATREIAELLDLEVVLVVRLKGDRAEVVSALGLDGAPGPRSIPQEALQGGDVFAVQRGGVLLACFEELSLREALVATCSGSGAAPSGFVMAATRQRSRELARELDEHRAALNRAAERIGLELQRTEMLQRIIELEAALRAKNEILAIAAHEARAPLSAILNIPERLASEFCSQEGQLSYGGSPDATVRQLHTLWRSAKHLSAVLTDILEYTKLDSGTVGLDRVPVGVAEVIADAREASLEVALSRSVDVAIEVNGAGAFHGDATRLTQIFINLITNAVKYSPVGGQVLVIATPSPTEVTVRVTDHGIGIPREHLARIFETFHQVPGAQPQGHPGTGLGLSIVHKLVELHGGTIQVESSIGRGSTFTVRLPRAGEALPTQAASTHPAAPPSSERRTIVIVDDDASVLSTAQLVLEDLGHEIVCAATASELAGLLENTHPHLLILDVSLGADDGILLLRDLRSQDATRAMPVLVWSGHDLSSEIFSQLGARWLRKPWRGAQLVELVSAMLAGDSPSDAASNQR